MLKSITELWLRQIELCKEAKQKHFGKTADRAWGYLGKSYRQLYIEASQDSEEFAHVTGPYYRTRLNKSREFVSLMLPYIFSRVPNRVVTPRRPQVPVELMRALPGVAANLQPIKDQEEILCWLMSWWLNYLPGEYGLYREARTALPEALVKGRGVVWHELVPSPTGEIPGSFFDSVDNLLIDADCTQMRDAGFIIRKRRMQAWRIAELFEVDVATVRAQAKSHLAEAAKGDNESAEADVCEFYEIFSRMGIGHRLVGADQDMKDLFQTFEELGPYVYLAVMKGIKHPLNLPPEILEMEGGEQIKRRVEWPIAFYEDVADTWPCTVLDFAPNQDNPWATSPLEAALPLQQFLDHAYSYLMSRVRATSRDLIVTSTEMSEAVRRALVSGLDQEIVPFDGDPGTELDKLLKVIQFPALNRDAWQVISAVERAFEQATGMVPLMYGTQGDSALRSAQEAGLHESHATSRPDDYADCVEQWMSRIAAKEAIASRLYVGPETVAPLFGEQMQEAAPDVDPYSPENVATWGQLTQAWAMMVNTDDPAEAVAELSYTVEAGSGRRKNKQKQIQDAQMFIQNLAPITMQFLQSGNPMPYNWLMQKIGEAYDVDLSGMQVAPPQLGVDPNVPLPPVPVSEVPEEV